MHTFFWSINKNLKCIKTKHHSTQPSLYCTPNYIQYDEKGNSPSIKLNFGIASEFSLKGFKIILMKFSKVACLK